MRRRTDRLLNDQLCAQQVNKEKMFMGSFVVVAAAITAFCISGGQALGLECAVCLPPDENIPIAKEIRRLFPDDHFALIGCHQVNASDENNTIVKTCPLESASCHIQKTKEWTAKTCSTISVDGQCKTANRVKYCYCKTNRCNLRDTLIPTTTTTSTALEDFSPTTLSSVESSSINSTHDDIIHETTARPKITPTFNSASSLIWSKYWLMALCTLIISYQ